MQATRGRHRVLVRLLSMLATIAVTVTAFVATAAPAQAAPSTSSKAKTAEHLMSSCWGSHTIYPDGWGFIRGSASTICDGTASYLQSTVYIREKDPFGFVWGCGTYDVKSAYYATYVAASTSCISKGAGYTYWLYSEHYASINGQVFSFTGGHWN